MRQADQLRGCVADADDIEEFLRDELKRFEISQITPKIQLNDPILIFFAGHGYKLSAPCGWEVGGVGGTIQGLLPQDYAFGSCPLVHGIPDRTVSALINDLSRKKGNNITVIYDCCHSGSGSRNGGGSTRAVELPGSVPASLGLGLTSGDIIVPGEIAREPRPLFRGLFTTALLKLLREEGVDKLVYTDVLKRIDAIPDQNPQCIGTHSDRFFFDLKCPPARRLTYPVRCEDGEYKMDAGAAHGISVGAAYAVYANGQAVLADVPSVGSLCVGDFDAVKDFETTMTLSSGCSSFPVGDSAVALQTKLGDKEEFPLYVPLHDDVFPVFKTLAREMKTPGSDTAKIKLVEDRDQAMLEIVKEDGRLYFNILDKRVTDHGVNRIHFPFDPEFDIIRPVLRSAAHYYWHLNRNSNSRMDEYFQSKIEVEFFELDEPCTELDDVGDSILRPDKNPENLFMGGIIKFTVKADVPYGMKITNNTKWDLYPGVFYFDNSNLNITPYYAISSSGKFNADSPFKRDGGTLTIGYGSTATRPRYFKVPDGDVNVGFFKMFLPRNVSATWRNKHRFLVGDVATMSPWNPAL